MNLRAAFLAFVFLAATGLAADVSPAGAPARIVQYIYDGNKTETRVLVTSFGGPVTASVSIASKKDSLEYTFELESEVFDQIWAGFRTIEVIKAGDVTENTDDIDTKSNHLIFAQEVSATESSGRTFSVAESKASPEFRAWLELFLPVANDEEQE
jgi:hypothetical protein